MPLAQEIKQLREELGLSQAALGKKLGVSANTVLNWETEKSQPKGATLAAVEAWLAEHRPRKMMPAGAKAFLDGMKDPSPWRLWVFQAGQDIARATLRSKADRAFDENMRPRGIFYSLDDTLEFFDKGKCQNTEAPEKVVAFLRELKETFPETHKRIAQAAVDIACETIAGGYYDGIEDHIYELMVEVIEYYWEGIAPDGVYEEIQ